MTGLASVAEIFETARDLDPLAAMIFGGVVTVFATRWITPRGLVRKEEYDRDLAEIKKSLANCEAERAADREKHEAVRAADLARWEANSRDLVARIRQLEDQRFEIASRGKT